MTEGERHPGPDPDTREHLEGNYPKLYFEQDNLRDLFIFTDDDREQSVEVTWELVVKAPWELDWLKQQVAESGLERAKTILEFTKAIIDEVEQGARAHATHLAEVAHDAVYLAALRDYGSAKRINQVWNERLAKMAENLDAWVKAREENAEKT